MLETAHCVLSGLARFRDNEKAEGVASDPCRTLIIANYGVFRTDLTTQCTRNGQNIQPRSWLISLLATVHFPRHRRKK
jgi:hypothetical protein